MDRETRFKMLRKSSPAEAKRLSQESQHDIDAQWKFYEHLASMEYGGNGEA
jgi:pyruvate-ferredoxin/flavodoxin oxidoreductase